MTMDWQIAPANQWSADAIFLMAFEATDGNDRQFPGRLDQALPWLAQCPALQDFQGQLKQVICAYGPNNAAIPRAILIGLGKADRFTMDTWREALVLGLRKGRDLKLSRIGLPAALLDALPSDTEQAVEQGATAGLLGLYQYRQHKTRDLDKCAPDPILVFLSESAPSPGFEDALNRARASVSGVQLARDLISGPSNQVTPSHLLLNARHLADQYPFTLDVIDLKRAQAIGMGAFAAVARGSREPAYCIVLEYAPEARVADPPLVLVGKGITFDTGGISLKPSAKLEAMKTDMAGAAAVLGAFRILGERRPDRRVIGIMPCTENMPDGKAYKPGDIIRSLSGQTIEVISTDAEGRMILCDALTYALRFEPAAIFDVATLTGACVVALGDRVAGLMGNREELVERVIALGDQVGEKFWPLPLWDFYFDDIKSDAADFKNVGNRKAGTIIGGIFLKQFVPDQVPWVHLDIAGPSWAERDLPGIPKGAAGFAARTLWEIVRQWNPGWGREKEATRS